jgi:hypothetical protein
MRILGANHAAELLDRWPRQHHVPFHNRFATLAQRNNQQLQAKIESWSDVISIKHNEKFFHSPGPIRK